MQKHQPKLDDRNFFVEEKPVCYLRFRCIHDHQMLEQAKTEDEETMMMCDSRAKWFCLTDPVWFVFF